jgi:hypothetical protein
MNSLLFSIYHKQNHELPNSSNSKKKSKENKTEQHSGKQASSCELVLILVSCFMIDAPVTPWTSTFHRTTTMSLVAGTGHTVSNTFSTIFSIGLSTIGKNGMTASPRAVGANRRSGALNRKRFNI